MLHHTENYTTAKVGQAVATVIADTISPEGKRITTFELVYPRYIHSELMTHRQFSRNASSSRATPLKVTLDEVRNDPVFFDYVGKNKSGMVAGESLTEEELRCFDYHWKALGVMVAKYIERVAEEFDIHKQTLNRALEPWLRIRTLVTATEYDNFFKLRLAEDAQPEIRSLALAMKEAMGKSIPSRSTLHLPYAENVRGCIKDKMLISVARCARVSYARLNGSETDIEADVKLTRRLYESGHFSPFEHVAIADENEGKYANFDGWQSYRNLMGE